MAPHSSTLAWKIPWMEEPSRLQPMGSRRVGHDWATSLSLFTFMHWRRKWQPIPVFLPGESQGRGSLVGCCLWGCRVGHDWSDLAAAAGPIYFCFCFFCLGDWSKKTLLWFMSGCFVYVLEVLWHHVFNMVFKPFWVYFLSVVLGSILISFTYINLSSFPNAEETFLFCVFCLVCRRFIDWGMRVSFWALLCPVDLWVFVVLPDV